MAKIIRVWDGTQWQEVGTALPNALSTDGTQTLTNKTITLGNNTITGTTAEFNTALSDANFATLAGTETLTNKTINLTSNTLTGTTAQFNTALSDANFATLAGSETLTNKTISGSDNTLTNIPNNSLTNSSITINGSAVSLGGTTTISTINPTIVDAKGDIITATAADTPAKLAVGNNGDTLVADSSTTTGLRYTAGNPISNPIINSCFDIWQRGTTFTIGTNTYGPDRWLAFRGAYAAGSTMSRQLVNDSTNLPNIQYCTRVQRDSGNTSTQGINFQYWQETSNSIPYAGKTVTLSFYARAGANYSSAANLLAAKLITGTGTDQNGATVSYTGEVTAITVLATLTTTWQRFTGSATLATNTNEYGFVFNNVPVGTAGANDYFEVTGVQVDIGSVALPVRRNSGTIQGELAACQRYYYNVVNGNNLSFGQGGYYNSGFMFAVLDFKVTMRGTPTLVVTSGSNYYSFERNSGNDGLNDFTISRPNLNGSMVINTADASGTAGDMGYLFTNNAASSIAFSAEL
jgi:hypothetical protein